MASTTQIRLRNELVVRLDREVKVALALDSGLIMNNGNITDRIIEELSTSYFYPPWNQARFLSFTHFQIACEIQMEGSSQTYYCSLCATGLCCASGAAFRSHYSQHHSVELADVITRIINQ